MKTKFKLLFLSLLCASFSYAQKCSNCVTEYNNSTEDVIVELNDVVCITGTYSGQIFLRGGKLSICGNADIDKLTFEQASEVMFSESSVAIVGEVVAKAASEITNYSDSLIIEKSTLSEAFSMTNHGHCYMAGGTFHKDLTFINTDTMVISSDLSIDGLTRFYNSKFFLIDGKIDPHQGDISIDNACQFVLNGDLNLDGQTVTITGGMTKLNNLNIHAGKIILGESSLFIVNDMTISGSIEGIDSRSTIISEKDPDLKASPSIIGFISICVGTGNFTAPDGTLSGSATVSCDNPIPDSDCIPPGYGKAYFRMVPQQSSDWKNSNTWEMMTSSGWAAPPVGRYPTKGCEVLIEDGKEMTVTSDIEVRTLVLG